MQSSPTQFPASTRGHPCSGDPTVLIADDNYAIGSLLARTAEDWGYRVVLAYDGMDAWEKVKNCVADVRIVITDHDMPRMCGTELIAALRDVHPTLPAILMSGRDAPRAIHGWEMAPTRFLKKPFTLEVLRATIADAMGATSAVGARGA